MQHSVVDTEIESFSLMASACAYVLCAGARNCDAMDLWAEPGSDEEILGPVTDELVALVPAGDVKFIRIGNCTD